MYSCVFSLLWREGFPADAAATFCALYCGGFLLAGSNGNAGSFASCAVQLALCAAVTPLLAGSAISRGSTAMSPAMSVEGLVGQDSLECGSGHWYVSKACAIRVRVHTEIKLFLKMSNQRNKTAYIVSLTLFFPSFSLSFGFHSVLERVHASVALVCYITSQLTWEGHISVLPVLLSVCGNRCLKAFLQVHAACVVVGKMRVKKARNTTNVKTKKKRKKEDTIRELNKVTRTHTRTHARTQDTRTHTARTRTSTTFDAIGRYFCSAAASPVASKKSNTISDSSSAPVKWNRMYEFWLAPSFRGTGELHPQPSPSFGLYMPNCVQVSS